MHTYILPFNKINLKNLPEVGGKNASLGEMFQNLSSKGIQVPDGFAITAESYWTFLEKNNIKEKINNILATLDTKKFSNLSQVGKKIRSLILSSVIPHDIQDSIKKAYADLQKRSKASTVAVRSSATAEDLPTASFAGQLETLLNVKGEKDLLDACVHCYSSLFTDRAIKYREDNGFEQTNVAVSVGVQNMVRSDKGSSGVAFTIDPETGFQNVIVINGTWGLGENIVQGNIIPDEFVLFKPSLLSGKNPLISQKMGSKAVTMIYDNKKGKKVKNIPTPEKKKKKYILSEEEVIRLGKWLLTIEKHYGRAMDIEWAKDGITGEIYIVQARPETVHGQKKSFSITTYILKKRGKVLTTGISLGQKIASGKARILSSPSESHKLKEGEVLVTDITNPDWDPIMQKAAAIITNKGGRTSHAAIVARELGTVAIVGANNATEVIHDGQEITVSCAEGEKGIIYDGILPWEKRVIDTHNLQMPKTQAMLILADPGSAFVHCMLPNNGVGLLRMEFIINNSIRIHPMALVQFNKLKDKKVRKEIEHITFLYKDKKKFFVDTLAQAVSTIAAAFYPKDVIVRMSDFKSNEYANLIGGRDFEPSEENPMLGFRGASRYYHEKYRDGFALECMAMKKVREEMGLTNVKLMIPFCRTVEEGKKVVSLMKDLGLKRGENGLEIYTMVEIPSNVILAEEFAKVFDGFSIGSNDLTQLTLGIDRDSELVSELFNENNEAVKRMISSVIASAKKTGTKIGLCGQAPSDFPAFAKFLVEQGINSISFNPDSLMRGIENMKRGEE